MSNNKDTKDNGVLYIRYIPKEDRLWFKNWCNENGTNMSKEVIKYIYSLKRKEDNLKQRLKEAKEYGRQNAS